MRQKCQSEGVYVTRNLAYSVVVTSPVEGDTSQGSNPDGTKKKKSPHQKIVVGCQPVAPVVGLGPPARGTVVVVASPEVVISPGYSVAL